MPGSTCSPPRAGRRCRGRARAPPRRPRGRPRSRAGGGGTGSASRGCRRGGGRKGGWIASRATVPRRRARRRSRRSRACSGRRRAGRGGRPGRDRRTEGLRPARGRRAGARRPHVLRPPARGPRPRRRGRGPRARPSRWRRRRAGPRRRAPPPRGSGAVSTRASARASIASIRPRRSVETPLPRNAGSTPSRPASHAIESGVGRVLPRSIWLMYSFENRSPATWDCVSPAARRSERSRSPRRDAGAEGVVAVGRRPAATGSSSRSGDWRRPSVGQSRRFTSPAALLRRGEIGLPNVGFAGEVQPIANHLTELLDFLGPGPLES